MLHNQSAYSEMITFTNVCIGDQLPGKYRVFAEYYPFAMISQQSSSSASALLPTTTFLIISDTNIAAM